MPARKPPKKTQSYRLLILPQKRIHLSWLLLISLPFIAYYFISNPNTTLTHHKQFKRPPPQKIKFNWHERQEHYPVSTHHHLPTSTSPPKIPKIQHSFNPPATKLSRLTAEQLVIREQKKSRLRIIKSTFRRGWTSYRDFALGHDVLLPISGSSRNSHNGWGTTLIESLETLWIMGLKEEFEEAVVAVSRVDFSRSEKEVVDVFGGSVGVLSGLLGAYDLSEGRYEVLLEKAVELGDFLYAAFDTPNRMPITRWEWKSTQAGNKQTAFDDMLLGELPALTLEFTRLTQLSGDPKFFDAVQRVSDLLAKHQNQTQLLGLWPLTIDAQNEKFDVQSAFTMGWMADGAYNYLPAQHLLFSGHTQQFSTMYKSAISTALKHTLFSPMHPPLITSSSTKPILFSSLTRVAHENKRATTVDGQIQHLSCYLPSLLSLGSILFSRPGDLEIAQSLIAGCLWAHEIFEGGIMPEAFYVLPCENASGTDGEVKKGECEWNKKSWLKGVMSMDVSINEENVEDKVEELRLPEGVIAVTDKRYAHRPQLIQSLFVLYRITGDSYYRDEAWKIFTSIEKATRTKYGNAALNDVTKEEGELERGRVDNMNPQWLGATLKWFYLLFSDEEVVSLDEWVISGEGHLMRWTR